MNKPAKSWNNRGVNIAAWDSQWGPKFTFKKTYKDKTSGEYKESKNLFKEDLKILSELSAEAYEWAISVDRSERQVSESPEINAIVKDIADDLDIPF